MEHARPSDDRQVPPAAEGHERFPFAPTSESWLTLLDGMSDGFLVLSRELVVTCCNRAAERLLNRPRGAMLGRHFFCDVLPEARDSIFEKQFRLALADKLPRRFETWFDVAPYANWYEVRVCPYAESLLVYFQVTTEQKRAAEALQQARNFSHNLLETANVMIVGLDLEGRILVFNRMAETVTGYAREEVLGRSCFDTIAPRGLCEAAWTLYDNWRRGNLRSADQRAVPWECPLVTRQGHERLAVWCSSEILENERVCGWISFGIDVTEQRNLLREREAMLRLLQLTATSLSLEELLHNTCHFLRTWSGFDAVGIRVRRGESYPMVESEGYPPDFACGKFNLGAPAAPVTAGDCICGQVFALDMPTAGLLRSARGSLWSNSLRRLCVNAPVAEIAKFRGHCPQAGFESLAMIPLQTGGETFGLIHFADRRSDQLPPEKIALFEELANALANGVGHLHLQQALRDVEKGQAETEKLAAVGRLAAQVAHEINNPLAGIKGCFQLFRGTLPADYPHRHYLTRIEQEVDRIGHIVRQMLDLNRTPWKVLNEVSVSSTIADVLAILEPVCRPRGIATIQETAGPLVVFSFPESALRQILYNLVVNAVEASPARAAVRVHAHIVDDTLHVSVADQGPGISEDVRPRIFEPFFTTKGVGGTGLGLSISKSLADTLRGQLTFECGPHGGTVFRLSVPVVQRPSWPQIDPLESPSF